MPFKFCFESLDKLWAKGVNFLGSRYGILGGAMTWISNHALVAAISQAGGFGVLAGGSLSPDELEREIIQTRSLTPHPFGVNLIVFHPQIDHLVSVCAACKVSHIFFGGGMVPQEVLKKLKGSGIKVVGFCPSVGIGKRMVKMGVDALVIEGHEAGGHVGPISTQVLAQEILPCFDIPLFVAGGIGNGRCMLSYLLMGAAGCQLGTRFVCASESCAHPRFKEAFIRAQARDATLSPQLDPRFPIIPVRALENQGKKRFMDYQKEILLSYERGELSQKEAQIKIELFWAGALKRAVIEGDVEEGSLMAGQSVGMVNSIEPCAHIIQSLIDQAVNHMSHHPAFSVA